MDVTDPSGKKVTPHPAMEDEYACAECEYTWYGEEMDCPQCGSTRTGMIAPSDEEIH